MIFLFVTYMNVIVHLDSFHDFKAQVIELFYVDVNQFRYLPG